MSKLSESQRIHSRQMRQASVSPRCWGGGAMREHSTEAGGDSDTWSPPPPPHTPVLFTQHLFAPVPTSSCYLTSIPPKPQPRQILVLETSLCTPFSKLSVCTGYHPPKVIDRPLNAEVLMTDSWDQSCRRPKLSHGSALCSYS